MTLRRDEKPTFLLGHFCVEQRFQCEAGLLVLQTLSREALQSWQEKLRISHQSLWENNMCEKTRFCQAGLSVSVDFVLEKPLQKRVKQQMKQNKTTTKRTQFSFSAVYTITVSGAASVLSVQLKLALSSPCGWTSP